MWEISNTLQVIDFLRAAVLGIMLCAVFGFFSSLRKSGLNSDFAVFLEDIIFFIVSSPMIFLFLLATTNGELRLYIIIGISLGFISFKLTFYRIYVFLLSKLFTMITVIYSYLIKAFLKIANLLDVFSNKMVEKMKNLKKALNSLKKGLKK